MDVGDSIVIGVFSILGTTIASLAGSVAWMTKKHLGSLEERVEVQSEHIIECNEDRTAIKEAHERLKTRTETLEKAFNIMADCPKDDCPNKKMMKVTSALTNKPSE